MFGFWPCHYLCKANNIINPKELAQLSDQQKYKGKCGYRISIKSCMASVHNWAWCLKVLCSEENDENNLWSGKVDLQRSWDLKLFKEESEGRRQRGFQHEGTDCQEEKTRGRIFLPLQWKGNNFLTLCFVRLSKEIEQSVCQDSWCPFQPHGGFSDLLLLHCSLIPDFIPSYSSLFKGSFWASFPFVDAYA